jgi:membrane-associated protein
MHELIHFFHKIIHHPSRLLNPEDLIRYGGLTIIFFTIYLEIGIFFCFFFPGDSLVFTAGVLCATGDLDSTWIGINLVMISAVVLGNMTAFVVGKKSGRYLMHRKESIFFKKDYMVSADLFYKKYGGFAFVVGSFLPVIRTFIPIVAGILDISYRRYFLFAFIGAIAWIMPLSTVGYLLGTIPWVHHNLGYIILTMVVAITVPVIVRIYRESKKEKLKKQILKELD